MNPHYPLVAERAGHRCEYGIDLLTNQRAPLFHPRGQAWHEHFDTQGDPPVLLVGKTATGRVTVERLQLNTAIQRAARAQWIALGLFP